MTSSLWVTVRVNSGRKVLTEEILKKISLYINHLKSGTLDNLQTQEAKYEIRIPLVNQNQTYKYLGYPTERHHQPTIIKGKNNHRLNGKSSSHQQNATQFHQSSNCYQRDVRIPNQLHNRPPGLVPDRTQRNEQRDPEDPEDDKITGAIFQYRPSVSL